MQNDLRLSYAPAYVDLSFTGKPGDVVFLLNSLFPQQICLFCYETPKSIKEISETLGMDAVYIKEVITPLLQNNVLKKVENKKIQTNFCMFPVSKAKKVLEINLNCMINKKIPQRLTQALFNQKDKILNLDFYGNSFDFNYLQWIFYSQLAIKISNQIAGKIPDEQKVQINRFDAIPIPGVYDFSLKGEYQYKDDKIENADLSFSDNDIWENSSEVLGKKNVAKYSTSFSLIETTEYGWCQYNNAFDAPPFETSVPKWQTSEILNRDELGRFIDSSMLSLLIKISLSDNYQLNKNEIETLESFEKRGFVVKENNLYKCQFPIFTKSTWQKIDDILNEITVSFADEIIDECGKQIEQILLPCLRNDKELESQFYTFWFNAFLNPDRALFSYGINTCNLEIPADYKKSAAGLYVVIEKQNH